MDIIKRTVKINNKLVIFAVAVFLILITGFGVIYNKRDTFIDQKIGKVLGSSSLSTNTQAGWEAGTRSNIDTTTTPDSISLSMSVPAGSVTVSGAGTAAVNGTYIATGTYS